MCPVSKVKQCSKTLGSSVCRSRDLTPAVYSCSLHSGCAEDHERPAVRLSLHRCIRPCSPCPAPLRPCPSDARTHAADSAETSAPRPVVRRRPWASARLPRGPWMPSPGSASGRLRCSPVVLDGCPQDLSRSPLPPKVPASWFVLPELGHRCPRQVGAAEESWGPNPLYHLTRTPSNTLKGEAEEAGAIPAVRGPSGLRGDRHIRKRPRRGTVRGAAGAGPRLTQKGLSGTEPQNLISFSFPAAHAPLVICPIRSPKDLSLLIREN